MLAGQVGRQLGTDLALTRGQLEGQGGVEGGQHAYLGGWAGHGRPGPGRIRRRARISCMDSASS